MADFTDTTGNSPQPPENKRNTPILRYNKRERQSDSWARKLRTLPVAVYRDLLSLLMNGTSALEAARWLNQQPERGGCQHLKFNTLRLYVQALRERVLEIDKESKQRTKALEDLAKNMLRDRDRLDNVVAIRAAIENKPLPPPPVKTKGQERRELAKQLRDACRGVATRDLFLVNYAYNQGRAEMMSEAYEFETGLLAEQATKASAEARQCLDGVIRADDWLLKKLKFDQNRPKSGWNTIEGESLVYQPDALAPPAAMLALPAADGTLVAELPGPAPKAAAKPQTAAREAVGKMKAAEYAQAADTTLHLDELVENKEVITKLREQRGRALERKRLLDAYRQKLEEQKKTIEASEKAPAPPEPPK
jgi:hypothetical protein